MVALFFPWSEEATEEGRRVYLISVVIGVVPNIILWVFYAFFPPLVSVHLVHTSWIKRLMRCIR